MNILTRPRGDEILDAFMQQFPHKDNETSNLTIFTMTAFDDWALSKGYYGKINLNSAAEMNAARNLLRRTINHSATRPERAEERLPCFRVEVSSHGWQKRPDGTMVPPAYCIKPAARGFMDAAVALPSKVRSIVIRRKQMLDALNKVSNLVDLPVHLQIELRLQPRAIEQWQARALLELRQMEDSFSTLRESVLTYIPELKALENNDVLPEDDIMDIEELIGDDPESRS